MAEAEVQPSAPPDFGNFSILDLLLLCHSIPKLLFLLVSPHVVSFRAEENGDREQIDHKEIRIATVVVRLVVISVYEVANNTTKLDTHLLYVRLKRNDTRGAFVLTLYTAAETDLVPTLLALEDVHPTKIASGFVSKVTSHIGS